ncbi:phosphatase PAP2 family protein [Chryseobacterium sp. sg2396]|nr:phosphatase PAP2 family protein [uncultured Chryseobacterium sp.]
MNRTFVIIFVFYSLLFSAQDSLSVMKPLKPEKKDFNYKKLIIPAGMITIGAVLKIHSIQQNLQKNAQKMVYRNFKTKADNYLQYAPVFFIFSGNSLGFESKNTYLQMEKNTLAASMITGGIVFIGKKSFKDIRPDNSARNSYPSGHSALSFTLATIQFLEYKDSDLWYASSGYVFATATALLRVANNRHWNGDVLTGAGIGIAVALIVDHWNPLSKLSFSTSAGKLSLTGYPVVHQNTFGLGISMNIQ